MKIYEKPTLVMMSIYGNDLLCDSCDIDIIGDNARQDIADMINMAGSNPFDEIDKCTTQIDIYCKFTGTSNVVVNS